MDPRNTLPLPWPATQYPPYSYMFQQTPGQQMNAVQSSATPCYSYLDPTTNIQNNVYIMLNYVPVTVTPSEPLAKPVQTPQPSQHEDVRYVNPKQLHRILKRREARQKLAEEIGPAVRGPYFNESRHNHAKTRPRGPGGKFLPKEEYRQYRQKKEEDFNDVTPGACGASGAEVGTVRG